MSKYVTNEAMRTAMTLQKGYIDQGDSNNAEGIDSLKAGKNMLLGVLTGTDWGSSSVPVYNTTLHEIDVTDGVFSIKEAGDNYIVSSFVNVEEGKTYTFSFYYINGGVYEIHIIGETNNHVLTGSGGGPISRSFTSVATEAVRIFIKTDDKKLRFPQLELGSTGTQFTASTEELKEYHDMDTREREATLLERVTELEDRMEEVVQTQLITTPPETLNAQVGYYYCMGGNGVVVDTMTIQLPAIADKNKTKNVQFFMTMGSAPEVTFVSAGTERILYQKDFALEAERSYEVNALWNGHAWVITVVEIIVPFFAKLSLNNGEVVKLQGSGELTEAMVSPYKTSLVSAEIGKLCTSIGNSVFDGCKNLTNVTIPDSVTSIGHSAFNECSGLTSVTIPDSVTSIGECAFDQCSGLTSITIGSGVTSISSSAFYGCTSLTSITIPSSVTNIGRAAFSYCTGLTSITIPDSVTSIGDDVFAGCRNLTNVTIPDSVTSIGQFAFLSCSGLTSITIPDSVTSIGERAFDQCSGLTSITIGSGVTSIGNQAFHNCTGLTSITIPSSVTSIDYGAFSNCTGLTSITIGNGVTNISHEAFHNCTGLTSITIPDSVTSIGDDVFAGCTGLTSVTIGSGVTSIGYGAFKGCSSLTSITSLATTAPTIKSSTFLNVKTGGTLTVPSGSTGYDVWMGTGDYYLGKYNWTKVEQ